MNSTPDPFPKPENRPGLSQIAYRIADYRGFLNWLLSQLPAREGGLQKLTTRLNDDTAIALLDAWAVVADVLTFYQERIANEGYLRTATERLSVLELARAIGYELNPGVAASTFLTFSVEDVPGSPRVATIPKGTQIMSIPRKDELPQTFETSENFTAYADWNALTPRSTRPQKITSHTRQLYLNSISTQLQAGDFLLLIDEERKVHTYLLPLTEVVQNSQAGYTLVQWEESLPAIDTPLRNPKVFAFRQRANLFGHNAPDWEQMPAEIKLAAIADKGKLDLLQGGIFHTENHGDTWNAVSKGLPNSDILCLVIRDGVLFAGTAGKGIFRSKDNGSNWEAVNNGLTNLNIQALYTAPDGRSPLFAGTPGGGVFRSKDGGENWVPINTGNVRVEGDNGTNWHSVNTSLPNTIVRSILTIDKDYIFVGTDDGLYNYEKQIKDWKSINSTDQVVYSLFYGELKQNKYLFAGTDNGLYRYSKNEAISGDAQKWQLALDNNSPQLEGKAVFVIIDDENFIFVGTDKGIYRYLKRGGVWHDINDIKGDNNDGLNNQKICSLSTHNQGENHYLFAATEQGIFRSIYMDHDINIVFNDIQTAVNDSKTSVNQFLMLRSKFYRQERENNQPIDSETLDLFGILLAYHFIYEIAVITGIVISGIVVQWTQVSESLPTQDITALTCNEVQKNLFAGSKFAGFLQSGVENQNQSEENNTTNQPQNKQEWPDFKLQSNQIDLDTLYPQVSPKTWIVLLDKDNSINQENNQLIFAIRQVKSTFTITRQDFGLTAKITRIEPDKAVENPDQFKLRSTVVLNRSEELELAKERLTVSDRQQEIFQDPIQGNIVFLSQFVQGLQPNQTLIVSGKHLRVQLNDIGGVYRLTRSNETKLGSIQWQFCFWKYVFLVNTCLLVLLALSQKYFEMHPRINRGLTNSQVRSLAINSQGSAIWAGTTEGIFRSLEHSEYWEPFDSWENINKTLKKKDIQALLSESNNDSNSSNLIFIGTAEGIFRFNDRENEWLKVNQEGIFRSTNDGNQWDKIHQEPGLTYTDIRAIAVYAYENKKKWLVGTVNGGVFQSENNGDSWTTTGLRNTDVQALVIQPYPSVDYIFAGTIRDGIFRSKDGGITWQQLSSINTGLTNLNITALASGVGTSIIFAGTSGSGVFRSRDNGDRWEQVNTNLTDLEIRCLTVDAKGKVWVGTAKGGVFYSDNQGELWTSVNTNLTNIDVQAILIPQDSQNIFVGGIGILLSPDGFETKPVQRQDVVQLLEPPTLLPNTLIPYQQWKVMDKDGFQGNLTTTQYDSVGVESSDNEDNVSPQLTLLPAAAESEVVSEVANIQLPPTEQQLPVLTLQQPLKYSYDPATVKVYANVVQATHGQTVEEVLGSGDGHQTNQRFALKKPPLTYVPTTTASGAKSTLEVRVNGVLWQEVPSLYPLTPQDQNYIIRIEDDGTTTVTFGDGIKGARLPSGNENVTATYRSGIGLDGNIAATRLSLLKTRPQGIVEVNNPLPATGAAPPESLEEAREKAPPTVRTLDRIVSLRDFEDFARGFAGIGKAQAVALWHEENHLVHITIAAVGGESVLPKSSLYTNLIEAINQARDPLQQVQVDSYDRILFNLEARFLINPRYQPEEVEQKVLTALKTTFAFPRRQFGQNVTAAEAIATMQNVEGVIAVDLDALYPSGRSKALVQSLPAFQARSDPQTNQVYPAQLLLLNPAGIKFAIVSTL